MAEPEDSAPQVVCAGVVVADHLCTPIDHLPSAGELVMAEDLVLNIGGCASNAAMDLARLGVRASVCGRVGDDAFGRFVADALSERGVDCRALAVDPRLATSQTLIVNVRGQDRRFVHCFGANRTLSAADIAVALRPETRVLYVGGYLILPGIDPYELAGVFRRAREQGTKTVLDVAAPGVGAYVGRLAPVLRETDVFLPNIDEADLILGEPDPVRQADLFRSMGAKLVVITRGEHGRRSPSPTLFACGSPRSPSISWTARGAATPSTPVTSRG